MTVVVVCVYRAQLYGFPPSATPSPSYTASASKSGKPPAVPRSSSQSRGASATPASGSPSSASDSNTDDTNTTGSLAGSGSGSGSSGSVADLSATPLPDDTISTAQNSSMGHDKGAVVAMAVVLVVGGVVGIAASVWVWRSRRGATVATDLPDLHKWGIGVPRSTVRGRQRVGGGSVASSVSTGADSVPPAWLQPPAVDTHGGGGGHNRGNGVTDGGNAARGVSDGGIQVVVPRDSNAARLARKEARRQRRQQRGDTHGASITVGNSGANDGTVLDLYSASSGAKGPVPAVSPEGLTQPEDSSRSGRGIHSRSHTRSHSRSHTRSKSHSYSHHSTAHNSEHNEGSVRYATHPLLVHIMRRQHTHTLTIP